ncbi:MAG TPA: hypothetical protein PLU87_10765 [Sedimentisphaerales bacterium]|nr:hypothetical protein [Sedimentisphaerales bacterium]HRS11652.1 hypothetical protein [Sedimentisphaerales bacterium]HRV48315.1 hypothetical protein [Sedimentisphaerales bacterium]
MDMYDAVFSASYALNEQVARRVFDALGESGPLLAIMDRSGNCWASDPEVFDRMCPGDTVLEDLWAQVDDGHEPVITQVADKSVATAQLATEHTNCGYLVLILAGREAPGNQTVRDLVEALFSQIALVARLIETSSLLSDTQVKCYSAYGTSDAPAN